MKMKLQPYGTFLTHLQNNAMREQVKDLPTYDVKAGIYIYIVMLKLFNMKKVNVKR